jgi:hypothetical protein
MNVTEPVGVPLAPPTFAVMVAGWSFVDGFGDEFKRTGVPTVTLSTVEVLGA